MIITSVGENMKKLEALFIAWWECKMVLPMQTQFGGSSKIQTEAPHAKTKLYKDLVF